MTADEAAEAGQASIEHLTGIPWCTGDSCSAAATVIDALVEHQVRQVPTLSVYDAMNQELTTGRVSPELEPFVVEAARDVWALQDSINAELMPANITENQRRLLARDGLAGALRLTGALADAGVPVLTGTDMGFPGVIPGFGLHREMALMVEAGLTPAEALRAATVDPATYLDLRPARWLP